MQLGLMPTVRNEIHITHHSLEKLEQKHYKTIKEFKFESERDWTSTYMATQVAQSIQCQLFQRWIITIYTQKQKSEKEKITRLNHEFHANL